MDVRALAVPQDLARGRLDERRLLREIGAIARADVDPLTVQIDVERAAAKPGAVEHLEQRVAQDEDLLAAADHPMLVIVRMRARLVPADEAVRPRGAEDVPAAGLLSPCRHRVGPGDDDVLAGRGVEANRPVLRATSFDRHGLAVDAPVDHDRVAGLDLRRGLRNCPDLGVQRQPGQFLGCDMPGPRAHGGRGRAGFDLRSGRRLGRVPRPLTASVVPATARVIAIALKTLAGKSILIVPFSNAGSSGRVIRTAGRVSKPTTPTNAADRSASEITCHASS